MKEKLGNVLDRSEKREANEDEMQKKLEERAKVDDEVEAKIDEEKISVVKEIENLRYIKELIIEEFIQFDSEITLLTVTQKHGPTLFAPPIGHIQQGGDYRESFQIPEISEEHLAESKDMAETVPNALT